MRGVFTSGPLAAPEETERLKAALRDDAERLRSASERVGLATGCDTPDVMADEIIRLRDDYMHLTRYVVTTEDDAFLSSHSVWQIIDAGLQERQAALASARNDALEEVARYHDDAVTRIRNNQANYKNGRMLPTAKRASNIHEASAAIEAMREPTDAMARKADGLTDLVGPYEEANTPEARQDEFKCAWRAMIDKAIQESGE